MLVLAVSFSPYAALASDQQAMSDAERAERAKFVGLWKGFVVEGKGENPNRGPVQLEITISELCMHGLQVRADGNIDHGLGRYSLNLASRPTALDAAKTFQRGRQQAYLGIYKLDGDTLYWCVSPQRVRPRTFETVKGQFLLVLRRDTTAGADHSRP
jgi:uncharacterized protein (TIGR03067 family)